MAIGVDLFFYLESIMKIVSLGFVIDKGSYLRDNWNKLDFFINLITLLELCLSSTHFGVINVNFNCKDISDSASVEAFENDKSEPEHANSRELSYRIYSKHDEHHNSHLLHMVF